MAPLAPWIRSDPSDPTKKGTLRAAEVRGSGGAKGGVDPNTLVVPPHGWFVREIPIKVDDVGIWAIPISGNLHIRWRIFA